MMQSQAEMKAASTSTRGEKVALALIVAMIVYLVIAQ